MAALILALLLPLWWLAGERYRERLLTTRRNHVAAEVASLGNTFSVAANHRLAQIGGAAAFVSAELNSPLHTIETEFESFESFASLMPANGVHSVALAPDGVIKLVYPHDSVVFSVGEDLLDGSYPPFDAVVQRAIASHQPTLVAPFTLPSGHTAVTVWRAIYQEDSLWGVVGMSIDLQSILDEGDLHPETHDLALAMQDASGQLLFGDEAVLQNDPVVGRIELANEAWQLNGIPAIGWDASIRQELLTVRGLGLGLLILIALLVYLDANRQVGLEQLVRRRTADLYAVHEIGRRLAGTLQKEEIYHILFHDLAQGVLGASCLTVALYDAESRMLHSDFVVVDGEEADPNQFPPIPVEDNQIDKVIRSGEPCVTSSIDTETVPGRPGRGNGRTRHTRPLALHAPLMSQDQVIGVICVERDGPETFSKAEQTMFAAAVNQAAVSLENAQLFAQIQAHTADLKMHVAERTAELRRMVNLMAGREIRMHELKEVIRQLHCQITEAGLTPIAVDPLQEEAPPIFTQTPGAREEKS